MHAPVKYCEKGLSIMAGGVWFVFSRLNQINQKPAWTPQWSDKSLLKSYEKSRPPLGWPRETDSLCPACVRETRQAILDGKIDLSILIDEKAGEIKATILERDGQILMVKDCPIHGHYEDLLAIDTAFFKHIEEVFPGRDIRAHNDDRLHNHGSSSIKYGRGAVLTIDLTNRCNMMCDPCFMDANQVGFVHELSWDEIKQILDNALTIKPRRQLSVQFSGGEPTLSPFFLDAVRYHTRLVITRFRRPPTALNSPSARSSRGRQLKQGCATLICNSTALGTPPILTVASGISSTLSSRRSKTSTTPVSTSSRSSQSSTG